jgi:FtsP/CotA-like multicopper oxidase with cupredoxin domain
MPDWSIVISDSAGSVTLNPDPQDVLSGDPVSWSNQTNVSQTITIDGQAAAAPMVAPPWDSSSPTYKVSLPANTQPPFSYTYTCKPTDTPSAPGVKGTLTIKSALAVLLVVLLGSFAPRLEAQQGCQDLFGVELNRIPEITRDKTKNVVFGTLLTTGESQYIAFNKGGFKSGDITTADITCAKQWVRTYRMGLPQIQSDSNQGSTAGTTLPLPGPTIRARVGDLVELTFMNLIDRINFPGTDTGKCDEAQNNTGQIYPQTDKGGDVPPNCFHGSIFTNVHYHGTHTSPTSAADNVFLEIVPWSREANQSRARVMPPNFNDTVLKDAFRKFYDDCELNLNLPDRPQQWPTRWEDLPETYRKMQEALLSQAFPKLWKDNEDAIAAKTFPQNYIGAFPYCFRLPVYTGTASTPAPAATSTHAEHDQSTAMDPVIMGQAPGTHWYHAHKHGSTTINVSNGMTGLLIVEGVYDDEINAYYDKKGGIDQKVIVLNQIGVTPNREGGSMPAPGNYVSVNGRLQPNITMKPGEVQWWRIADTSARSGLIFTVPAGLKWRQLAVDGVQLANTRYVESENGQFVLASGNRVDLLVMAPPDAKGKIPVKAVLTTDPLTNTANTQLLFNVVIDSSHGTRDMGFMDRANTYFPPYLKDITKVNGYKTILFATNKDPDPPRPTPIFNRHTINGKQFHGEVSVKVDLNQVEEWKIVNASYAPKIAHPFHIHINPFQITEEFEPNALLSPAGPGPGKVSTVVGTPTVTGTGFLTTFRVGDFITIAGEGVANVVSIASDTTLTFSKAKATGVTDATYTVGIPLYSTNKDAIDRHPGQCFIDPAVESSWHPCGPTEPPEGDGRKWWDVFSIPSGQTFYTKGSSTATQIPGYFTMRSRFVDYSGHFVIHCHILAHEDRGMMTGVYVGVPEQLPFAHH